MKLRGLPLTVMFALALAARAASAQMPVPQPAEVASSPRGEGLNPRLLSPKEMSENAARPRYLKPENAATPQIVIPLRKAPPDPLKLDPQAGAPSPPRLDRIDDAAARCDAQPDAIARAACRDRLKRDANAR